jgi:glycosyltransferase involved in cell wall biosynthesis
MGKPLITGDSMAARELLEDGKNAILCEMGNPQALADAILRLKMDPRLRQCIGNKGRTLFENRCRPKIVGMQFAHLVQETLKQKGWRNVEAGERDHS